MPEPKLTATVYGWRLKAEAPVGDWAEILVCNTDLYIATGAENRDDDYRAYYQKTFEVALDYAGQTTDDYARAGYTVEREMLPFEVPEEATVIGIQKLEPFLIELFGYYRKAKPPSEYELWVAANR